MKSGFTKGFLAGSIAATTMMSVMNSRNGKRSPQRLMKNGRHLVGRASRLAEDLMDMFR